MESHAPACCGIPFLMRAIFFLYFTNNVIAGRPRAVSLRTERSLSRGFPSLDLDTVLEERSDPEQTQVRNSNLKCYGSINCFSLFYRPI